MFVIVKIYYSFLVYFNNDSIVFFSFFSISLNFSRMPLCLDELEHAASFLNIFFFFALGILKNDPFSSFPFAKFYSSRIWSICLIWSTANVNPKNFAIFKKFCSRKFVLLKYLLHYIFPDLIFSSLDCFVKSSFNLRIKPLCKRHFVIADRFCWNGSNHCPI